MSHRCNDGVAACGQALVGDSPFVQAAGDNGLQHEEFGAFHQVEFGSSWSDCAGSSFSTPVAKSMQATPQNCQNINIQETPNSLLASLCDTPVAISTPTAPL